VHVCVRDEGVVSSAPRETCALWWWVRRWPRGAPPSGPRRVAIVLGGNNFSVEDCGAVTAAILQGLMDCGCDVLMLDREGVGRSAAHRPRSLEAMNEAAAAIARFLREHYGRDADVAVWAHSMGGATGTRLAALLSAAAQPPRVLVLASTFARVSEVRIGVPPPFTALAMGALGVPDLAPEDELARVAPSTAVRLVHSVEDELIPFEHAERNLRAARAAATRECSLLPTRGSHSGNGGAGDLALILRTLPLWWPRAGGAAGGVPAA